MQEQNYYLFRFQRKKFLGPMDFMRAESFINSHAQLAHEYEVAGPSGIWQSCDDRFNLSHYYPELLGRKSEFEEEEETKQNSIRQKEDFRFVTKIIFILALAFILILFSLSTL